MKIRPLADRVVIKKIEDCKITVFLSFQLKSKFLFT